MKKTITAILCLALMLSLAACASAPAKPETPTNEFKGDGMTLSEIFEEINSKAAELPAVSDMEITPDSFKSFLFIDSIDGAEALASEGMISSVAHSAVLLRVPEGKDAAAVAQSIFDNANPTKWICVSAEKTAVVQHGNTILLVMSFTDTTDELVSAFNALYEGDAGLTLEKDNNADGEMNQLQ